LNHPIIRSYIGISYAFNKHHTGKVWTGCIWLRTGTSGGLLWTRCI